MRFEVGNLVCYAAGSPTGCAIYEVTRVTNTGLRGVGYEQNLELRLLVDDWPLDYSLGYEPPELGSVFQERNGQLKLVSEMIFLARVARGDPHVTPEFQNGAK